MYIGRHPNQVNGALLPGKDVCLVITAAHIRHHRNLQIRIVLTYNSADVFIFTKLPFAIFGLLKHFPGGLIAKFHIIHTGLHIGPVQLLHKIIGKIEIIHQAPVTQGCVQHLNVRTKIH